VARRVSLAPSRSSVSSHQRHSVDLAIMRTFAMTTIQKQNQKIVIGASHSSGP
jgi:hypothetical protein